MKITYNEALKSIRDEARENNCSLVRANYNLNGKAIYNIVDKFSRITYEGNLWSLYNDYCAGYINYTSIYE